MPPHPLLHRHEAVAAAPGIAELDGLVVTNLSNIRYLTGFGGSAGLLVVTPARLYLLVDFRYSAAVESLVATGAAPPDGRGSDTRRRAAATIGASRSWLPSRAGDAWGSKPGTWPWRAGDAGSATSSARLDDRERA